VGQGGERRKRKRCQRNKPAKRQRRQVANAGGLQEVRGGKVQSAADLGSKRGTYPEQTGKKRNRAWTIEPAAFRRGNMQNVAKYKEKRGAEKKERTDNFKIMGASLAGQGVGSSD